MPEQADFSEEVDPWRQSTVSIPLLRYLKERFLSVFTRPFNTSTPTFCLSLQQQHQDPQHQWFSHRPRPIFHLGPTAVGLNSPGKYTRNWSIPGTLGTMPPSPGRKQIRHLPASASVRARACVPPASRNLRVKSYYAGVLTYQTGTGPGLYSCLFLPQT